MRARTISLVMSLVLVAQVVVSFSSTAERAMASSPGWPQDVSDVSPEYTFAHKNGDVTVARCNGGATPQGDAFIRTFDATGNLKGSVTSPNGTTSYWCGVQQIDGSHNNLDSSGAFYVNETKYTTSYTSSVLSAYLPNGQKKWASIQLASVNCAGKWMTLVGVTVGADGGMYAVLDDGNCVSGDKYLLGVNTTTGAVKFRSRIGNRQGVIKLAAYSGGLVIREDAGSVNKPFEFFTYAGARQSQYNYTPPLGTNIVPAYWTVRPNGEIIATTMSEGSFSGRPSSCSASSNYSVLRNVYRKRLGLTATSGSLLSSCISTSQVNALPNGNLVILGTGARGTASYKLVVVSGTSGSVVHQWGVAEAGRIVDVQVDMFGGVLVTAVHDDYVVMRLHGSNGAYKGSWDSSVYESEDSDTFDTHNYMTKITQGAAYSYFSKNNEWSLYRIRMPEVGQDYPRSSLFGTQAQPAELWDYVALGDSFSSGEGVEEFIPGTDIPGINECHRSKYAYAWLLDQNATLPISLYDFSACSGATISDVVNGMYNENSQLAELDAGIGLVTITAGGNDALFGAVVFNCLTDWVNGGGSNDCGDAIIKAQSQVASIGAPLSTMYGRIALEVGPSTKVIVLGYPHILPSFIDSSTVPLCSALSYSREELSDIWELTVSLNTVIQAEAVDAGFDYVPVADAFSGHSLCDTDPYFIDVDIFNPEYSYHPNRQGQEVYATVIVDRLTNS